LAEKFLKAFGKIGEVVEANLIGDLGNTVILLPKQLCGPFKAEVSQ
jgi:hypothetical protein